MALWKVRTMRRCNGGQRGATIRPRVHSEGEEGQLRQGPLEIEGLIFGHN